MHVFGIVASRLNCVLSEMQGLEDRVAGRTTVFHIVDNPNKPLLYNQSSAVEDRDVEDEEVAAAGQMTVCEMLESMPIRSLREGLGDVSRNRRQAAPGQVLT